MVELDQPGIEHEGNTSPLTTRQGSYIHPGVRLDVRLPMQLTFVYATNDSVELDGSGGLRPADARHKRVCRGSMLRPPNCMSSKPYTTQVRG